MIIPKEVTERDQFYEQLIKKCTSSQEDRKSQYASLRGYYLFGGDGGFGSSPFNKIYPHIDMLTSFLFASETTKFSIGLGANAEEHEHFRTSVLSRAINDRWLESGADKVLSSAITWALVNNSMLIKLCPEVNEKTKVLQIHPFPVHPGSFGVLREDITFLDRQEAFTHSYYTTKSQLEIDLRDHPNKVKILESIQPGPASIVDEQDGIGRLMMGTQQPLSQSTPPSGQVAFSLAANMNYSPDVAEEVVEQIELWVWDTEESDYRVVTKIRDGMIIYDRKNFFLEGEHAFVQLAPLPLPFYFWGMSEVAGLAMLQEWRNERVDQVRKLLNLQVRPPTSQSGFGIQDEMAYALFAEGGMLSDKTGGMGGNAKVERFSPTIPQDIFGVIHEIDAAFSEHSGLPNTVQGKGEVGVRSGKQAGELARLGSARIKKRSLIIEDALEKLATLYLKLMRKYDKTTYNDEKGTPFVADQFTSDFIVKVDAHSNSPIFVEDKKELAFTMLKAGLINGERCIDIIDAPDKEILKREFRELEAKKQAAQQAEQQAKAKEEAAKGGGQ